ncbi:hypothetical protein LTR91_020596 [Friedmanniomyces endolithicus]|uniref:Peptidase A1 domain-containing protein n=1 Tax=Friedmanniomyces endolithicus TaxID=329885 RepID=A0AAN6K4U2_9PEZI|nr:hypothetical protein LTR57_016582 [Friedmanniomyces endolithicus]KAK0959913.1 hypothetical protein LTR91_020596 [Friedmanniomyces endolithicus]KAK1002981.1 hypothetical protein LTS01_004249 [Friedmanniomyces endolithicus]KAK1033128.1 hypothetical protein LTS16_016570 [Friedmanniomyces endolithicus]
MLVLFFFLAAMALALPSPQRRIAPKVAYIAIDNPINSLYSINASIGTPPQVVTLMVDTGSDTTWMDDKSAHCLGTGGKASSSSSCASSHALFDPAQSDSYTLLSKDNFEYEYGGGDGVQKGAFFADSFSVGSTDSNIGQQPLVLHDFAMGLAIKEDMIHPEGYGMLGMSPKYPATWGNADMQILDVMAQQGIPTRSFSMSLGHINARSGSLLLGGHDPSKYEGSLSVVPMERHRQTGTFVDYRINVSSVALTDSRGTTKKLTPDDFSSVSCLDSGDDTTYLPPDMLAALVEVTGAFQTEEDGWFYVPYDKELGGSMDLEFGGLGKSSRIAVKLSDFFAPEPETAPDGTRLCWLKADTNKDDGELRLNQPILRSAYVVHYFDEKVLGLAQAKDVDQGVGSLKNVVEIKPGDSLFRRD